MIARAETHTAALHEIFSGIQGEGVCVGYRQLFVRFHGCPLCCRYCDTPASRGAAPATFRVEMTPGRRDFIQVANPAGVDAVLEALWRLQRGYPHQAVSLTGGEPLLHVPLLNALLPAMHAAGLRASLETNGALPAALAALTTVPAYLAMDIKLASVAGAAPAGETTAAFLHTAARLLGDAVTARLQVKLVFGEGSLPEIVDAAARVAAVDAGIPCVLQPVTPRPGGPPAPSPATVLEAQRLAARALRDVRVIPQTHVMLGQL